MAGREDTWGRRRRTPAPESRSSAPGRARPGRGSSGCWPLVVAFAIVAWARSRQVDIPFKDPHGKLFRAKLPDTAEFLLAFVVIDVVVRWLRGRTEGATLWSTRAPAGRRTASLMILAGLVAYFVVYFCYRNLKSWDVLNAPQGRHAPARGTGGCSSATARPCCCTTCSARTSRRTLLTDLYESFSTLVTIALVAALAFTPTVRQAYVFVVSAMWVWILGVGSYYLIPSLGPFHAAPGRVRRADPHTSIQDTQARVPRASAPTCWPTRRPPTPSPRSPRSPACTAP